MRRVNHHKPTPTLYTLSPTKTTGDLLVTWKILVDDVKSWSNINLYWLVRLFPGPKVMHFAFPSFNSKTEPSNSQFVAFWTWKHVNDLFFVSIILNFGCKNFPHLNCGWGHECQFSPHGPSASERGGQGPFGSWRWWWYTWFCKHLTEGSYAIHILFQPDGIAVITWGLPTVGAYDNIWMEVTRKWTYPVLWCFDALVWVALVVFLVSAVPRLDTHEFQHEEILVPFNSKKTRWLHVTSDFKPFGASFSLSMFLAS